MTRFIEEIKFLSYDNKYTKTYVNIIEKRRKCPYSGAYTEGHHIVPSSFEEGNGYMLAKNNIVTLTAREHYICHLLLTKMIRDSKYLIKARFAYSMMARPALNNKRDRYQSSMSYQRGREQFAKTLRELWSVQEYRDKQKFSRTFYNTEEHKSRMSAIALEEMQNPKRRLAFVKAGLESGKKVRDKDKKAWVLNSMGSDKSRKKAKEAHQSVAHREACSQRELSKSPEERSRLAKTGQLALVKKCGGEKEYRKMLSDRIKGRKKYIDPVSKKVRVTRTPIKGWILLTEYNKGFREEHYGNHI